MTAPLSQDQHAVALRELGQLDSETSVVFDRVAEIAARAFQAPVGMVNLLDADRQWSTGAFGWYAREMPRDVSFCSHAIAHRGEVMVVEDATADARFRGNPLVTNAPKIRFYAGAPLYDERGNALGALCVIGSEPRSFDASDRQLLLSMAGQVEGLLKRRMAGADAAALAVAYARAAHVEQDQLLAIVSSSIDLQSFIDRDYVYRYVNARYLDYWERRHEDIVGHSVSNLLGADLFNASVKALLDRAFAGETTRYEASFDYPVKGRRRMAMSYTPARDRHGAIFGVVATVQDIEDLKRGADLLAASLRELEEAQAIAKVGNWDWNIDTGGVTASRELYRLFGVEPAQLTNINEFRRRLHPDDRARVDAELAVARSGALAYEIEFRVIRSEGGYRDILAAGHAVRDTGGRVAHLIGACQDISHRKTAERALRESEQLNRSTFEQAAVGIAHVGADGSWLRVNDRLCQIVGYPRENLLASTFQDITHPDDLDTDLDLVRRVLAGEIKTYSMEKRYIHRDLSTVWINLTVSLVRDARGKPLHFISIVEDIDARKRSEYELRKSRLALTTAIDELQQQTVSLQRFIHVLSHDMREPLNTIVNFSGLLAESAAVAGGGADAKYLDFVQSGARRMQSLLSDLLNYVRLDRAEVRGIQVDLESVMRDVCADLMVQIERAGATVECAPLPLVVGDPSLLRLLLQNLVSNAIKFVEPDAKPVVKVFDTSTDSANWRIAVNDTGIGISEDAMKELFTPFTRLNTRRRFAGTGLGLAICKRIADMHGGTMEATSTPGAGTCFTLVLPRVQE